ncbi:MAG: hypothetical protein ACLR6J_19340 [Parabacteroides merdae]
MIIAPAYDADALEVSETKEKSYHIGPQEECKTCPMQFRSLLNGVLMQEKDLSIQGGSRSGTDDGKETDGSRSGRLVVRQQDREEQQV